MGELTVKQKAANAAVNVFFQFIPFEFQGHQGYQALKFLESKVDYWGNDLLTLESLGLSDSYMVWGSYKHYSLPFLVQEIHRVKDLIRTAFGDLR